VSGRWKKVAEATPAERAKQRAERNAQQARRRARLREAPPPTRPLSSRIAILAADGSELAHVDAPRGIEVATRMSRGMAGAICIAADDGAVLARVAHGQTLPSELACRAVVARWRGGEPAPPVREPGAPPTPRSKARQDRAATFLLTALADGARARTELATLAAAEGISGTTLLRAAAVLGVAKRRVGQGASWALPPEQARTSADGTTPRHGPEEDRPACGASAPTSASPKTRGGGGGAHPSSAGNGAGTSPIQGSPPPSRDSSQHEGGPEAA
jgi:hypothetical protein